MEKPFTTPPQIKILGNLLSDDLLWDKHVLNVVLPAIRNRIRSLKLTSKFLGKKFTKDYINATYRSKLMFAI